MRTASPQPQIKKRKVIKMKEKVKTHFTWDDLEKSDTFSPCKYCGALDSFPSCEESEFLSSACNHCAFNIVEYCRTHNV